MCAFMKTSRVLRAGLLTFALATSAMPAVALAQPKPPAGKKPAPPPAKAPEKAAPAKDAGDDSTGLIVGGVVGGLVVLGGLAFVVHKLTSSGGGGGGGGGARDPEEAVSIFVDVTKGEEARRAQVKTVKGLSDLLGSSSDTAARRRAEMVYAKLAGALADPLSWVRATALEGLREVAGVFRYEIDKGILRQPLMPAVGLLGDADPAVRVAASGLLAGLLDQVEDEGEKSAAVAAIARLLDDGSEEAQAAACLNLGSCGSAAEAYWGGVAAKLGSSSETVRAYAASGLWMIGNDTPDPGVVSRLTAMLRGDPSAKVRADTANALGKLGRGSAEALSALVAALDDRDKDVRHFAIFALGDHAEDAGVAVGKLASMASGEHRDAVGFALQAIGTAEARQALTAAGLPLE